MINSWEKFNESHWLDNVKPNLTWDRDDDIRELFNDLVDMGFNNPIITHNVLDNQFRSPGRRLDYVGVDIKLYISYHVICRDSISRRRDVDSNIEIYENLITLLNRIRTMGFKISYNFSNGSVDMDLIHPSDVVNRSLYIKDEVKDKIKSALGLEQVEAKLTNIAKICDMKRTPNRIKIRKKFGMDRYNLEQIYTFVRKILAKELNWYNVDIVGDSIIITDIEKSDF